jgi:hypothetical protein
MKKNNDWSWLIVTMTILLSLVGFEAYGMITGKPVQASGLIIGALIVKLGTMIDFRWGSSKGSKDKMEMLTNKEQQQ